METPDTPLVVDAAFRTVCCPFGLYTEIIQVLLSQIRLTEMKTPDQATVIHDDGTDLQSTSPVCYTSNVGGVVASPGTAVTLALRLDFQNTTDEIILGAVGVKLPLQRKIIA